MESCYLRWAILKQLHDSLDHNRAASPCFLFLNRRFNRVIFYMHLEALEFFEDSTVVQAHAKVSKRFRRTTLIVMNVQRGIVEEDL